MAPPSPSEDSNPALDHTHLLEPISATLNSQGQEEHLESSSKSSINSKDSSEGEDSVPRPPLPDEEPPPLPDEVPPPLPTESAPPLPEEPPPSSKSDDGWEPVWDDNVQAFYFYNRFTKVTQWENPRVPSVTASSSAAAEPSASTPKAGMARGYNPAIHGDYDPDADYAKMDQDDSDLETGGASGAAGAGLNAEQYAATGAFNRFTGKWQNAALTPENFNDESKSKRQMGAFFDVDAAANTHDGRSLKDERRRQKYSRKEMKAFKEKYREKKEAKRRAWLKD